MKSYVYYVKDGDIIYGRNYDEGGNLLNEFGFAFPEQVVVNDIEFKVGDVFEAEFKVVNPPDCKNLLHIGKMGSEGEIINGELFDLEGGSDFFYKKELKEKGSYTILAFLEMDCESLIDREAKIISVDITVN